MVETLIVIPIILIAAFVAGELFKKIGFPPVVGQILAGMTFGIPLIKTTLFGSEIQIIVDLLAVLNSVCIKVHTKLKGTLWKMCCF